MQHNNLEQLWQSAFELEAGKENLVYLKVMDALKSPLRKPANFPHLLTLLLY